MIIYNGFKPGETRTTKLRVKKADQGHSIVRLTTYRPGSAFRFTYTQECQCGVKFRTERSPGSLYYRWTAHLRKQGISR